MGRLRAALLVVFGVLLVGLWGGATAASAADATIKASDVGTSHWEPANVTIDAGEQVTWNFTDAATSHDVTATGGNWTSPDSTSHGPGSAPVVATFDEPGVYTFVCSIHPSTMQGSVTVEEAAELTNVLVFSKTGGFRHDSIDEGIAAIQSLGAANGFTVTATEDATAFTDQNLAQFDVVVFLSTTGEVLDASQQTAFENYIRSGGGFAGIHAASDTEYSWPWYGELIGGYFRNHPAGTPTASVDIEDADEPSTSGVPERWTRTDEWYNFQHPVTPAVNGNTTIADYSPRARQVHVLATVDESTYGEDDGNSIDDDHPVAWCSDFDGGRSWYTAMGHTAASFSDPDFLDHLLGGLQTAAGAGNCGEYPRDVPPVAADFEKVTLNNDTNAPMEIDIADDGRAFYIELDGRVQMYTPGDQSTTTIGTIPVSLIHENGLLGIQLAPDFNLSGHIYLAYATLPDQTAQYGTNRISRFTYNAVSRTLGQEQVIYTWRHQRAECCHTGGSLDFGPDGSLYLSTGDNTNPFAHGFNPTDERPGRQFWDSQRTSANTNDPNGKILRILPIPNVSGVPADQAGVGATYTIPSGNLFAPGTAQTLPEIYAMGFRNPFRIHVDEKTGWVLMGDYGPDAGSTDPNRGPQGSVEFNVVKEPGFYGWPYCVRQNVPYHDIAYTSDSGAGTDKGLYNCDAPVNDSPNNTGLTNLPPAIPATMWMGYSETDVRFPDLGGGGAPTGGTRYYYDAESTSDTKFPPFYDGHWFIGEWNNDWVKTTSLNNEGLATGVECFAVCTGYISPMDIEFGPNGSMYVVEWGQGFAENNADSGVYRVDYVQGERLPIANATVDVDTIPVGGTVNFSSAGSNDPDGTAITYLWDFKDGTPTSSAQNPTHTFAAAGTYDVTLTVTDESGATSVDTVRVIVGNERPVVTIVTPENGKVADFGDKVEYEVTVTDPDGGPGGTPLEISEGDPECADIRIEVKLGHDTHAHELSNETGCSGDFTITGADGHGIDANVFTVLTASYTDDGSGPAQGVTGLAEAILQPKLKQAEYWATTGRIPGGSGDDAAGITNEATTDVGGGNSAAFIEDGDWISFNPYNLEDLDKVTFRVSSGGAGGFIELHYDDPTSPAFLTSPLITPTGGWQTWKDVTVDLPDTVPAGTHRLFLVFRGPTAGSVDSLMNLNWFKFTGKGAAVTAPPEVTATATPTSGEAPLDVAFDSTATDAEGEALTYAWDFGVPGDGDTSTQADPTYTYTTPGNYTATVTVTDASGGKSSATAQVRVTRPLEECPTGPVRSDEFDGAALDTGKWEVLRPDAANTLSVSDGNLNLPIGNGSMYLGGTSAKNLVVQETPEGEWTATAKIEVSALTENYQQAGLRVWSDDDNWASVHMIYAGTGRDFEFIYENDGQPRNEAADKVGGIPADAPLEYYVRITSDGTDLTASYSFDGVDFEPVGRPAPISAFPEPIKIGPAALSDSAPSVPVARFDWIRFDPDGTGGGTEGIVDEFDGTTLGDAWTRVRGDQSAVVSGGTLQIPAQPGDIYQTRNDAKNLIVRDAPDGAWEAVTKLNFKGSAQYHQAGIMVYGDDANFTKFGRIATNAAGSTFAEKFEFINEVNSVARNEAVDSTANLAAGFPNDFWLKLTSDGTNVTGSYSTDGTAWTPVGRGAALPADAKIGLFAFSNDGTGNPVAAFDSFTLTGDEVGGGGGGGGGTPAGPSFDDQFDGSSLDKDRWNAIVRDVPADYAVSGGELTITTGLGDIYTGDTNPPPPNFLLQDASHAGEDWVIETKISGHTITDGYTQGGLMAHVSGDNYVKLDAISDVGNQRINRIELRSEVAGAVQNPQENVNVSEAQAAGDIWLRLTKAGDNYTGEYSFDGTTWTAFPGGAVANPMADPDFGLFAFAPQASGVGETVSFDYFTLDGQDPPSGCECVAGPGDEFDGAALDKTKWNAIVREDDTSYEVSDGALRITTVAGDIYTNGDPSSTRNFILQQAPAGDWVIETKVSGDMSGGYEHGGLMVRQDDDNYIKFDVISDDGQTIKNRIELRSELAGAIQEPQPQVTKPAPGYGDVWLRLTKTGTTYSGEFSEDGETWTSVGAPVANAAITAPTFGLFTLGVNSPGATVVFDYFSVDGSTGCEPPPEENNPPELGDVTASPTIGVGPLQVNFTATATDEDEDDLTYAWDFQNDGTVDSTQQNPTFTYTTPGTKTAKVTVSDGEVERSKTLTVQVLAADDAGAEFRVLVFSKTTGFRHDSIDEGIAAIQLLGQENDFQVDATEDASVFRADLLSHYDTVVFLSTTGDPLNDTQQAAFEDYIQGGGGYTGIHAAADTEYAWGWYGGLVGGYFRNHPAGTPSATVNIEDTDHPSTTGITTPWPRVDEWYNYQSPVNPSPGGGGTDYSPRANPNIHVLATVDEATYAEDDGSDGVDDDHPISWCQRYDGGRSWYTGMGHTAASFSEAPYLQHLLGGLRVSAGVVDDADCGEEAGTLDVTAFADPTSGTAPLQVNFTADVGVPNAGGLTYKWTFPGGGTAFGSSVTTTFTTAGTKTVTVEVTDADGNVGTDTVDVVVTAGGQQPPVIVEAEADVTSGAAPLEVWFHAVANDPDGPESALIYHWNFGDGGSALGDEAEHVYEEAGTYTATLTVTDQAGQTATKTFTVTVTDGPGNEAPTVEAAAVPSSGPAPLQVLFTAQGSDPDGDVLTYAWNYGDGSTGTGRRARHTYTANGTYTATVTAKDSAGNTATDTVQIVVGNPAGNQAPTVQIAASKTSGKAPLTVQFTAAGSDPDGDQLSYVWDFGDGGAAGGTKVNHQYKTAGSYTAKVTVTDPGGKTGTATVTITVTAAAGAGANAAPPAATGATLAALTGSGVSLAVSCEATGTAKVKLRLTRKAARKLGLASRRIAVKSVRCTAGKTVTVKVRASKKARKALTRKSPKSLRIAISVALGGLEYKSVNVRFR